MFDLMGNMEEQQKALRSKLDAIIVEEQSEGGAVSVRMNANKQLLDIKISPELVAAGDSEHIEDLLMVAFNAALEAADSKAEEVTRNQIDDMLPGGLGQLFGQ